MANSRSLAAAFGVLSVAWILLGYAVGYFASLGIDATGQWIVFVTTALMLVFTPAVMVKARWTALGAVVAGIINIIKHAAAVIGIPTSVPMSMIYGPVVSLVLALLFTYFSFQAYRQK